MHGTLSQQRVFGVHSNFAWYMHARGAGQICTQQYVEYFLIKSVLYVHVSNYIRIYIQARVAVKLWKRTEDVSELRFFFWTNEREVLLSNRRFSSRLVIIF